MYMVFPPPILPNKNRYTNAGDTVLGIGVESTDIADVAIERGRAVEFYLLDYSPDQRAHLEKRIDSAFHKAHGNGMFHVRVLFRRSFAEMRTVFVTAPPR